jgi:outer membrane biosynthesis protein TonB
MSKNPRFWRNVTLIAVAHVALIAGLIRWSLTARSAPNPESLVWLSAGDLEPGRSDDNSVASSSKISIPSVESETQAKSEIELPKPTPMETPVPKATPKSTPKKTVLAKAIKSSAHAKSSPPKSEDEQTDSRTEIKKSAKTPGAKTKSSSDNGSGQTGSVRKGGGAGGGSNASEFGWYGNMLHDRFYSAWIQPTTTVASGAKISTLVKVRIEKDGRVSKFDIIKPSENVVVNESVAAVAKRVTEVDPPPVGIGNDSHYDVKINFELNTNQETPK